MMKKLCLFVLLCALSCFAQQSDITYPLTGGPAQLSASSTDCSVANSCLTVTASGYGMASVAVRGTYTGSTIVFEFSDDGGVSWFSEQCTRTDAAIQETSEALPSSTLRAWDCGVASSKLFRVRQSAIATGAVGVQIILTTASIEPAPTVSIGNTPGATDPCQIPTVLKSSAPINITSAATTQLVALAAGQKVYVCGYAFSINQQATTAATLQFEYGTGASCGTGTTALTGTFGAGGITAGIPIVVTSNGAGSVFASIAGNAVCAVTAGPAGLTFQGVMTFVQQ